MTTRIDTIDAADVLDELISRAIAGEDIVFTIDGQDIARLVPSRLASAVEDPVEQPASEPTQNG